MCTLPKFKQQEKCRDCENHSQWRCDSGWCINRTKVGDGVPDCPIDMSDEKLGTQNKYWRIFSLANIFNNVFYLPISCNDLRIFDIAQLSIWMVFVITMAISIVGIMFPFLGRFAIGRCRVCLVYKLINSSKEI